MWQWLPLFILGSLLTSCDSATPDTRPTELVVPGDSVLIQEPDSLALGRRTPLLLRAADGRMVLAEFPAKAVYAYAPDGRYLGAFGRVGEGPGEYRMVTGMALLPGDSLLAVADLSRPRLIIYRMDDRTFVNEITLREPPMPVTGWAEVGERMILPMALSPTPFHAWHRTTGVVDAWGETPSTWPETSGASGYARTVVVPVGERVLTALPFDSVAQWRDQNGRVVATELLPRRLRRGEPKDAVARIKEWQRQNEEQFHTIASMLLAGHRFSGNRVGVLHADLDGVRDKSEVGFSITGSALYLTMLGSGDTEHCTDARIPVPFDEYTWPAFTGDTIWFIDRSTTSAGSARTMVRGMVVRGGTCN